MAAQLFHADGRTDVHDEANSRFSQSCERASEVSRDAVRHPIAVCVCWRENGVWFCQYVLFSQGEVYI